MAIASDLMALRWQLVTLLGVLMVGHYAATAVATRSAVTSIRLPFYETLQVQLAAAAANRLSPAGLGSSVVNARFFTRRGLSSATATGAVTALSILGSVADLLLGLAIVFLGPHLGLTGVSGELHELSVKLSSFTTLLRSVWLWMAVAALLTMLATRGIGRRLRAFTAPVTALITRPRQLATLLLSSSMTTLILAVAFVVSVRAIPGGTTASAGALIIAHMLAAAAGGASPVPGGIGTTEAALTAVLVAAGSPLAQAVQVVVLFRVVTFWLPPLIGLALTPRLRRAGAL